MESPVCDYCGCRSQPAIDELSEEHDRLLDLVYGLRRHATPGGHATVTAILEHEVVPLLRHHTDKEERGLFEQLRSAWGVDDRLATLVAEHRDIDGLVDHVLAGGPDWAAAVHGLVRSLSRHIADEETDLFPYALYELAERQWDAVEAVHGAAGDAARLAASPGPGGRPTGPAPW
jgi:hemerythrin-like domain-containing protein